MDNETYATIGSLSREFFSKHSKDCTPGELRALLEIRDARKRLAKLDEFLAGLR